MPNKTKKPAKTSKTRSTLNAALTGINYLGSLTGYWGDFHQNSTLSKLSPEENARRVSEYRTSLGFDLKTTPLPSKDLFNTYAGTRIQSANNFSKVTAPDGTPISDKLKGVGVNKIVSDAIANALKLSNATADAQLKFTNDMANIDVAIKDPKSEFHPGHMIDYMHELKSDAHAAIAAQHVAEKRNLTALFNDGAFITNLQTSVGTTTSAENDKIKQEMLTTLEESQKKELDAFDKGMEEPLQKMHSAAKIENARVAYLARLYEQNATMRKEINKLHAQNQHQDPGAEVTISQEKGTALFKNMKITDLPYIETITGRKIEIQKQANGQSSFSMKLPNHLLSSGYYRGSNNKVKADLMGIAGAIRASGSETITMKIQHKDQEKGMELIRAAYEASIEAGFDPKKITLELNGKPVSASEAFATCPSRLNAANSQASKNSTATEAAEKAATGIGYKRFKDDLNNGRLADATAKAEARVAEERAMGKDPMLRNTNP